VLEVTGGTLTIDAAAICVNTGIVEANGRRAHQLTARCPAMPRSPALRSLSSGRIPICLHMLHITFADGSIAQIDPADGIAYERFSS